jgi:PAS domain S-box-containing protein
MRDSDLINASIERDKHTVLVVDDDPATRYATARVLRAAGFRTQEAATGMQALAAAPQVSAMVLDVHLPDLDGFEVCRLLRAQPQTAHMPVMHVSAAYVQSEDKVAGLNAGADAYLVRPVEPAVLIATLQALIRARMAEDQLRRSEARFRAIYTQAQSGIALIDAQGRFEDVNPALARLLNRSRLELGSMPISHFAPPDWAEYVRARTVAGAGDGASWQGEFPLTRPNGSAVYLEWSISAPLDSGIRVGIALDASERRELAHRRQELLEREQAARVVAERHSRTKDDFIAVLSHELRTPLHAIVGWVHILSRRTRSEELLKGLEAIDRSVKAQVAIISDILDVSRISSGKLRLQREWTDLAELIATSMAGLRGAIEDKQLRVEQNLAGIAKPAWLDVTRFQQIFWNLMTNAIKFSEEEGEIRVTASCDGERLSLSVQDFGQGIPSEFIDQLFDRFSQSETPSSRLHGGLGLGLSIVKHLVELHGGTVQAQSEGVGKGTTMRVEMPVSQAGARPPGDVSAPAPLNAASDAPSAVETLRGLDVLVVEDNPDASEMLGVVLRDRGARVRLAIDFDSAIRASRNVWPDVLVSDIGLPGRDGYELIRELRRMAPTGRPALPAIALTAFARPEDRTKALAAGFDEHLGKPLDPHALVVAIGKLVQPSAG